MREEKNENTFFQSVENALCDSKMELESVKKSAASRQAELESALQQTESKHSELLADVEEKEQVGCDLNVGKFFKNRLMTRRKILYFKGNSSPIQWKCSLGARSFGEDKRSR